MNKIILIFSLLFSINSFSSGKCFRFDLGESGKKLSYFQIKRADNAKVEVKVKSKNEVFENDFICIEKSESFLYIGDDDSGKFELKTSRNEASISVRYLNMGEPDGPLLSIRSTNGYIKGTQNSCK